MQMDDGVMVPGAVDVTSGNGMQPPPLPSYAESIVSDVAAMRERVASAIEHYAQQRREEVARHEARLAEIDASMAKLREAITTPMDAQPAPVAAPSTWSRIEAMLKARGGEAPLQDVTSALGHKRSGGVVSTAKHHGATVSHRNGRPWVKLPA